MSTSSQSTVAIRWMLEDWVRKLVLNGRESFCLVEVAASVGVPVHLVFDECLRMVRQKKLVLAWFGKCRCGEKFNLSAEPRFSCPKCGGLVDVFPKFLIAADYAAHLRGLATAQK